MQGSLSIKSHEYGLCISMSIIVLKRIRHFVDVWCYVLAGNGMQIAVLVGNVQHLVPILVDKAETVWGSMGIDDMRYCAAKQQRQEVERQLIAFSQQQKYD